MCCAKAASAAAFANISVRLAVMPRYVCMCHRWDCHSEMKNRPVNSRRGCLMLIMIAGIIVIVPALVLAAVIFSPALAAQGSDLLRNVIGDMAVSQLESAVFQIQDTVEQWRYDVGLATSCAPWATAN